MKWNLIRVMTGFFVAVLLGMAGCGGGSSNNAPNNKTTAANAGPAQNVVAGSLVTLNGSQSTGADGSLITYQWSMTTKPAGSTATIINPTTVNPTFTPDLSGQYSLKLLITDTKSVTSESTVTITASVVNAAPMANAGTAQSVVTGAVVTLDGSASSDANGDLLTYSWAFTSKPAGSSAALSSATVAKPTFTADVTGAYVLNLVVNDGKENSAAVTVTITASVANAAPMANAGTAQSVVTGAVVTLDGSASSDANGDLLTYSWAFTSKPAGSSAALSSATVAKPTFTADVAGAYVLNLVVNDGKVNSVAVTVTITASVANAAPVANAGTAQSVVTGAVVTLDGSASSDANGDLLTYSWAFTSKPAGSSVALSSASVAKPNFTPDIAGSYVISLIVSDGKAISVASIVTIQAVLPKSVYTANFWSNSISVFSINPTTGILSTKATVSPGIKPVSVDIHSSGKFAFILTQEANSISVYDISATTGALTLKSSASAGTLADTTTTPQILVVDPTGKYLYVASYATNNITSAVTPFISSFIIDPTSGNLTTGTVTNARMNNWDLTFDPTGKYLYVANYGSDKVLAYSINQTSGELTSIAEYVNVQGPSSIAVHPNGKFAYVSNFNSNSVSIFTINQITGALTFLTSAPTGTSAVAGTSPNSITVDPSGSYAYTANYWSDNISVFIINQTSGLLSPGTTVAAGSAPLSITVETTGEFLYASNGNSNNISMFSINQSNGALTSLGSVATGSGPRSIVTK